MQDGEGGARDIGAACQPGDETFNEHRLTASQVSFESQNRSDADILRKSPSDRLGFSWAIGNERSHQAIFDCRFSIVD